MATPAASAYDRRRALATPSTHLTSMRNRRAPLTRPSQVTQPPKPSLQSFQQLIALAGTTSFKRVAILTFCSLLHSSILSYPFHKSCAEPFSTAFLKLIAFFFIAATHAIPPRGRGIVGNTMLTCSLIVLQTLMLAYITFGPSLMGLCPTYAHILPSRQEIGPQTASAIVATLLLINFPPIANSLSLDSLSVRMLPTLFMRAFRPTILSIAPACLLYLLSSSSQPFLASIVHAFYRMYAIFVISHATVFVWMLSQSIQDAHFVSAPSDAIDHITATGPGVHTPMLLAQIRRHLRSADSLKAFPVFLDATGQTWRSLHTHLIFALQKVNADLANAQLHPQNLFISSPRSSPTLSARQAQPAIHACDIIRMVIPACTSYDSYGVAHGNIPDLLVILLRLKEATTNYITSHDMQAEANDEGSAITRMAMSLKGIFKTGAGIVALDDALSLCVYSIVGEYREYLSRLLGGGELGWDRGCDVLLRSFLDFQVP